VKDFYKSNKGEAHALPVALKAVGNINAPVRASFEVSGGAFGVC